MGHAYATRCVKPLSGWRAPSHAAAAHTPNPAVLDIQRACAACDAPRGWLPSCLVAPSSHHAPFKFSAYVTNCFALPFFTAHAHTNTPPLPGSHPVSQEAFLGVIGSLDCADAPALIRSESLQRVRVGSSRGLDVDL
jgi:hypothetical protein